MEPRRRIWRRPRPRPIDAGRPPDSELLERSSERRPGRRDKERGIDPERPADTRAME